MPTDAHRCQHVRKDARKRQRMEAILFPFGPMGLQWDCNGAPMGLRWGEMEKNKYAMFAHLLGYFYGK